MSAWGHAVTWGKTGRVRVDRGSDGEYNDVYIDGGDKSGNVDRRRGKSRWRAVAWDSEDNHHEAWLDSFDAGVLYILRRVDPALWRQERGAWLVRKRKPGEGIANGWHFPGPREYNPWFPWLLVDPNGVSRDACADIPTAHRYVTEYAKAATR